MSISITDIKEHLNKEPISKEAIDDELFGPYNVVSRILSKLCCDLYCEYNTDKQCYQKIDHKKSETIVVETSKQPILAVIDDKLALEALGDNIIVKEDPFKTGYECQACDGSGHTKDKCPRCNGTKIETIEDCCLRCNGTGKVKDLFRPIDENPAVHIPKMKTCNSCEGTGKDPEFSKRNLQPGLYPCRACICRNSQKDSAAPSGFVPCPICKGLAATVVIPEDSVRRPNSGTVVSTGKDCTRLKTGDKVLYSNHTGLAISFKRNIIFRWMREDEIPIQMHGVESIHKYLE